MTRAWAQDASHRLNEECNLLPLLSSGFMLITQQQDAEDGVKDLYRTLQGPKITPQLGPLDFNGVTTNCIRAEHDHKS